MQARDRSRSRRYILNPPYRACLAVARSAKPGLYILNNCLVLPCENRGTFSRSRQTEMQRRLGRVLIALAFLAAAAPARAQQQIVIEATQPAGEPMMMPPGLGGPRQLKTGTGRIL